jgi:hypothetical protein
MGRRRRGDERGARGESSDGRSASWAGSIYAIDGRDALLRSFVCPRVQNGAGALRGHEKIDTKERRAL